MDTPKQEKSIVEESNTDQISDTPNEIFVMVQSEEPIEELFMGEDCVDYFNNHTRLFLFADDLGLCTDGDSMPPEEYHDILEQLYIIKT